MLKCFDTNKKENILQYKAPGILLGIVELMPKITEPKKVLFCCLA